MTGCVVTCNSRTRAKYYSFSLHLITVSQDFSTFGERQKFPSSAAFMQHLVTKSEVHFVAICSGGNTTDSCVEHSSKHYSGWPLFRRWKFPDISPECEIPPTFPQLLVAFSHGTLSYHACIVASTASRQKIIRHDKIRDDVFTCVRSKPDVESA